LLSKLKQVKKNIVAKQINLKVINSIIILSPENIVDFVLATPAISSLKAAMPPEGKITAIVPANLQNFALNCKFIDKIVIIKTFNIFILIKSLSTLLFKKFDIFINFEEEKLITSILALLINSKIKLAYLKGRESRLFNFIYNLKLHSIDVPQHKIVKYLNLVRFIGANTYDFLPKINISEEDKNYAIKFLEKNNITAKDIIIGIHPTLKDEKKRWSLNKFQQLTKNLIEKYNAKIIVFYHHNEKDLLNEFIHITKNQAIVFDTCDYLKISAIARFCNCVICNETDFIHILSPFTNLIVIWGDSSVEQYKPAGLNHEILKPDDGKADSVPVSKVLEHIKKFID